MYSLRIAIDDMLHRFEASELAIHALQSIFACAEDHIYVSELETDEIIFMNEPLLRHLGLASTPVGQKCWQVINPDQTARCANCPEAQLKNTGDTASWDEFCPEASRSYRITISLISWIDGSTVLLHSKMDVADLKNIEAIRIEAVMIV